MATDPISYDKAELRAVLRSFKAMDDEAISQAKERSSALADLVLTKTRAAARNSKKPKVSSRIADGAKVSKSSKIGEISYGYVGQKFSGGATTQQLWGGNEFGSNKFRQFPVWSGRNPNGGGSRGWWIYPTLRAMQPEIIARWEQGFSDIVKRFD
jgi:hypothetical protein